MFLTSPSLKHIQSMMTSFCSDCSVCSKNYSASFGFVCEKCFNNAAGSIIFVVVIGAGVSFVFAVFLSYMLSGETENRDRRIVARVTRYFPLQSIKIIIVVWQILTQVGKRAAVRHLFD